MASVLDRLSMPRPVWGAASTRRTAAIAGLSGIGILIAIGALRPQPVAGGQPATTGSALAASTGVGSIWGASDPTGGLNVPDLIIKGIVVIVLLFITLRVLGRMQADAPKKLGRMKVLESRVLAPKASLHLVAVGERRLVVGLTPNGMVSLAELDAAELESSSAEPTAEAPRAQLGSASLATSPFSPAFGSILSSMIAPIDAITGRLAGLLGGGRVR